MLLKNLFLCIEERNSFWAEQYYVNAFCNYRKWHLLQFPILRLGKTTVDEDQKASIHEALSYLDKFLEGGSWVAGNKMTIADCACVASVSSIVVSSHCCCLGIFLR
jgi:glutathione S-transferase